jgi:hypothetical protein
VVTYFFFSDIHGAIRVSERCSRPAVNLDAFFHRYGDQEKTAMASFAFLDSEAASSSERLPASKDLCPLGSSPSEERSFSPSSFRVPQPPNRTVAMLKEDNRQDVKENKR